MNQMVFVLHNGTIQLLLESDLTFARLSAIISPYLAKFMKHEKSNAEFLYETVIIFSKMYLSEATYEISSFSLMTEL